MALSFDFMRSGKHLYPVLWDAQTMTGPEQTVLNSNGGVIRPGDSLIVEFKDPSESSCNPSAGGWKRIVGIDGGRDFEFQSLYIKLTDTSVAYRHTGEQFITIPITQNYFNNNFRFRLRLKAKSDDIGTSIKDDDDAWYIDNMSLQVPRKPEIEVTWVRIITPYAKIPYSAAATLPVYVSLKNNTTDVAIAFPVKVSITDDHGDIVYTQTVSANSIRGGKDSVIRFPDWNAQNVNTSSFFTVTASMGYGFFDSYTLDNKTYSTFYLNVEKGNDAVQEFAYDDAGITPTNGDGNDIPFITGIKGAGIGFQNMSGSYAMKFTLPQSDTVFGTRIYFASGNSAPDAIRISLLHGDPNSCIPGDVVQPSSQSVFEAVRGGGSFDQFVPYYFPKPMAVAAGTYWLSVSQLALDNFMMGGDLSRGGGEITVADELNPKIAPIYQSPYGTQWSSTQNNGDVSCAFAVETPAGSGSWQQWMPQTGYWPANGKGNAHQAIIINPEFSAPYVRAGAFMPMIRVMVGSLGSIHVNVASEIPNNFAFERSYPNPFTPGVNSTEMNFTLPESSVVSLIIYDEIGREIRTLVNGRLEEGRHTLHWDGRKANGEFVSAGVYFCRLSNSDNVVLVRIIAVQ